MVIEELKDFWLLNYSIIKPKKNCYFYINIAKLTDPKKGKKYIIFNTIIASALKDSGLLFIKRIKPILNIKKIIKIIKN